MELRRAEVAKKRPTWMLAVTAIAVLGIVGAVFLTINAFSDKSHAEDAKSQAEKDRDEAVKQAHDAQDKAEAAAKEVANLGGEVNDAQAAVAKANTQAERDAANQRLAQLQKAQADAQRRAAEAAEAARHAQRIQGISVSKECQNNPLAKGCS